MIMDKKLCATCVALAVLGLVMAVPQGSALAGMKIRTADLCLIPLNAAADGLEDSGIGTVAAVTDTRSNVTAWAVSLEGMLHRVKPDPPPVYYVYDTGTGGPNCEGDISKGTFFVYTMTTDENGEAYTNSSGPNPKVGDVIQICRDDDGLIPILSGVLVKGGKERNKPNRCR